MCSIKQYAAVTIETEGNKAAERQPMLFKVSSHVMMVLNCFSDVQPSSKFHIVAARAPPCSVFSWSVASSFYDEVEVGGTALLRSNVYLVHLSTKLLIT